MRETKLEPILSTIVQDDPKLQLTSNQHDNDSETETRMWAVYQS